MEQEGQNFPVCQTELPRSDGEEDSLEMESRFKEIYESSIESYKDEHRLMTLEQDEAAVEEVGQFRRVEGGVKMTSLMKIISRRYMS